MFHRFYGSQVIFKLLFSHILFLAVLRILHYVDLNACSADSVTGIT